LRREAAQPTPDLSQGETRHTDKFISGLDHLKSEWEKAAGKAEIGKAENRNRKQSLTAKHDG
jgi:hypothetical protein